MTTSIQEQHEPVPLLACTVCHEIPVSADAWRESSDYVVHYCGLDCYDQWRRQAAPTWMWNPITA